MFKRKQAVESDKRNSKEPTTEQAEFETRFMESADRENRNPVFSNDYVESERREHKRRYLAVLEREALKHGYTKRAVIDWYKVFSVFVIMFLFATTITFACLYFSLLGRVKIS